MKAFEWKPWDEYSEEQARAALSILVEWPPCQHCKFWRPQIDVDKVAGAQRYNGVILCHAETMYRDFSCFDSRN